MPTSPRRGKSHSGGGTRGSRPTGCMCPGGQGRPPCWNIYRYPCGRAPRHPPWQRAASRDSASRKAVEAQSFEPEKTGKPVARGTGQREIIADARGSLETQFQAAFLVTFVAADKSHPPEAKKEGVPRLRTWGTSGVRRSCGADRVVRPYAGTSRTPSPTEARPEVKQGRQPCGCLPLAIWVYRWLTAYLSYISTSFSRCS